MTATQTTIRAGACDTPCEAARAMRLRDLALRALRHMYLPEQRTFAFRRRRVADGTTLEGVSNRYTAVALLGLAAEPADVIHEVLAGHSLAEVCGHLIERVSDSADLGEVALALWSARALDHPAAEQALSALRARRPHEGTYPTVEVAWALTAQVAPGCPVRDEQLADALAQRLMASFHSGSALFPHWPKSWRAGRPPHPPRYPRLRAHVACFADLVYPIQALAHYHQLRNRPDARAMAQRCADRMCALQGPAGQWWWHYDVRTGRIVEPFPVYAVHQDSMAPMALHALAEAGGGNATFNTAIQRGLDWLDAAPELQGRSLIDEEIPVIWRKVARREPGKLVRCVQAGVSGLHPALRLPAANYVFPPGRIDYECRPYHLGWILYAWPPSS